MACRYLTCLKTPNSQYTFHILKNTEPIYVKLAQLGTYFEVPKRKPKL